MSFYLNFNPLKRSLLILCVILSRTVVPCSHSRRPATDCLQSFVTYSNLYLRSFSAEKTTFLIPLLRKMNDLLLKSISHKAFAWLGAFRSGKRALRGRVNRLGTFLWMKLKVCLWIYKTLIKTYGLEANIESVIDGESFRRSLQCKKKKCQ